MIMIVNWGKGSSLVFIVVGDPNVGSRSSAVMEQICIV